MSAALVALYAPYCDGAARRGDLERALALLAAGALEGERRLQPDGARRFQLSWSAPASPLESCAASLCVDLGEPGDEQCYSFELPAYRLVLWLMDWIAAGGPGQRGDLPDSFWRWLILGLDPAAVAA